MHSWLELLAFLAIWVLLQAWLLAAAGRADVSSARAPVGAQGT